MEEHTLGDESSEGSVQFESEDCISGITDFKDDADVPRILLQSKLSSIGLKVSAAYKSRRLAPISSVNGHRRANLRNLADIYKWAYLFTTWRNIMCTRLKFFQIVDLYSSFSPQTRIVTLCEVFLTVESFYFPLGSNGLLLCLREPICVLQSPNRLMYTNLS